MHCALRSVSIVGRPETERFLIIMRTRGNATKYPGVYIVDQKTYWIRAKALDLRTGKTKEVEKLIEGVSLQEAARQRAELIEEARNPPPSAKRVRVREYAPQWLASKKLRLDPSTAGTYEAALENRILPALGDYYYDALTSSDVQKWVDDVMKRGWKSEIKGSRGGTRYIRREYTRNAIAVWFRVFRTMTRDAMVALDLPRDPTLRVSLPEPPFDTSEPNALSAKQLAAFLAAMKRDHAQHYGLVATLAFTGLRFCHASALRWDDWDQEAGVIRVVRKSFRGKEGPVSRKKQAPAEYPVEPQLAEILRDARLYLIRKQNPGLAQGYMFPSRTGTLRTPNSLDKAFVLCRGATGIAKRFTVHGLRYTFTDLVRRANVDAVVRRALTGHVTEEMQRHYSNVGMDEKRAAIAGVIQLVAAGAVAE